MKAFYLILGRTQERLFDWIYENIHRKTSWHWSFKGIVSSQAYLHVVNLKWHACIPRDLGMGKCPPSPLIAWHLTARLLTHNHLFANQTKCQKVILQLGKLSSDFFIYTSPSNLMIAGADHLTFCKKLKREGGEIQFKADSPLHPPSFPSVDAAFTLLRRTGHDRQPYYTVSFQQQMRTQLTANTCDHKRRKVGNLKTALRDNENVLFLLFCSVWMKWKQLPWLRRTNGQNGVVDV